MAAIVYKSHKGGIIFNLGVETLKLSGYGLVDMVDDKLWDKAKKAYSFLVEWEKDGLIEVGQKARKDIESFENAVKSQDEKITANDEAKGVKISRNKK